MPINNEVLFFQNQCLFNVPRSNVLSFMQHNFLPSDAHREDPNLNLGPDGNVAVSPSEVHDAVESSDFQDVSEIQEANNAQTPKKVGFKCHLG